MTLSYWLVKALLLSVPSPVRLLYRMPFDERIIQMALTCF
jgi:hypothetical protein